VPTSIFIVRPSDPYAVLSGDAVKVAEKRLPARVSLDPGPIRFIGACEADTEGDARRQLEARLASLPPSMPKMVVSGLHD